MAVKHIIRTRNGGTESVTVTARRAIQYHCVECMGFVASHVKECSAKLCPLFPFRLHKTPTDTVIEEPDEF